MVSVSLCRNGLELLWLNRVSQARERYVFKTEICKSLLTEPAETFPNIRTLALHQTESEALHEYVRVMKIYLDLVTQGKAPPEDPAA
jgi:hypothetical protein